MYNPWVQFLLLLAPVILVPLALHDLRKLRTYSPAIKWSTPAAASLVMAHLLPSGPAAGFLAVPWLLFSIYIFWLIWTNRRKERHSSRAEPILKSAA